MEDNFVLSLEAKVNLGLDLRMSGALARLCNFFPGKVYLQNDKAIIGVDKDKNFIYGSVEVDGKGIIGLMGLAEQGDTVRVYTEGNDSYSIDLVSKIKLLLDTEVKSEIPYDKLR